MRCAIAAAAADWLRAAAECGSGTTSRAGARRFALTLGPLARARAAVPVMPNGRWSTATGGRWPPRWLLGEGPPRAAWTISWTRCYQPPCARSGVRGEAMRRRSVGDVRTRQAIAACAATLSDACTRIVSRRTPYPLPLAERGTFSIAEEGVLWRASRTPVFVQPALRSRSQQLHRRPELGRALASLARQWRRACRAQSRARSRWRRPPSTRPCSRR